MTLLLGFMVTLLLGSLATQTGEVEKQNTVGLLCGRLNYADTAFVNGVPSSATKRGAVDNAKLRLYRRQKHIRCCPKQSLVAETITGKAGSFDFKSVGPGSYWLVGRRGGERYELGINYDPSSQPGDKCSDLDYEVRDGKLRLGRMITITLH